MKFRTTLLAAGMMAVVGVAQAQPVTGPYVAGGAGVNIMNNFSVNLQTTGGVTTSTPGTSIRTETGFAGVASLGWGFGNGFRAEVEGNYRTQRVGLTTPPGGAGLAGGRQSTYGIMVNALYDFDIGTGAAHARLHGHWIVAVGGKEICHHPFGFAGRLHDLRMPVQLVQQEALETGRGRSHRSRKGD